MKFIIYITIIFFFISNTALTQTFKGGCYGGFVASQIDGDSHKGYNKSGYLFGITVKNIFDLKNGYALELRFIEKGSKKNIHPETGDYTFYRMVLRYVEIPVLYNFNFKTKWIFEGGITLAYLIKSIEENEFGEYADPMYDEFYKFSSDYILGINYLISPNFYINFRFEYSALPVRKHPANQKTIFDLGQSNNLISTTLYYWF